MDTADNKLDVKLEQQPVNIDQVECDDTPPNMSEDDIQDDGDAGADEPKSPPPKSQHSHSELEISPHSAGPNLGRASAISV